MKRTATNRIKAWAISNIATWFCELVYRRFPPVVRIETTNACNASCVMCPHKDMTRPTGIMEQTLYEKIVRECADNKVRTLHLHNFGEPLIDRRFCERIALAKNLGIPKVKFFTNASLLTKELAGELLEAGPDEIKVSLDGASNKTFSEIRKRLDYDNVIENIRRLIEMRNAKGMKKPEVKLNFVVRKDNRNEIPMFRKQWEGVVDRIYYDEEHNWSGDGDTSADNEILHACLRIWNTFTILWDGRVALCCLDYNGREILGDIISETIAEVWRGERLRFLRSLHSRRDFNSIPICRHCSKIR